MLSSLPVNKFGVTIRSLIRRKKDFLLLSLRLFDGILFLHSR